MGVPRHCVMELDKNTYFKVGKLFALSLMHGGPGPTFLAPSVINYMIDGSTKADVLDIPEKSIQNSLLKVIIMRFIIFFCSSKMSVI